MAIMALFIARQLNSGLKCFPTILLGIQTAWGEDFKTTEACTLQRWYMAKPFILTHFILYRVHTVVDTHLLSSKTLQPANKSLCELKHSRKVYSHHTLYKQIKQVCHSSHARLRYEDSLHITADKDCSKCQWTRFYHSTFSWCSYFIATNENYNIWGHFPASL